MSGMILRPYPNIMLPAGQVKPQGVPQIDWTHPLAQSLISYYFDTGLGFYIDLVTGNITTVGTGSTYPSVDASPNGTGFVFAPTGSLAIQDPSTFSRTSWAAPYSFAVGFQQLGTIGAGTQPSYAAVQDASGNDALLLYYLPAQTSLFLSSGNAAGLKLAPVPAANTFNVAAFVTTGASSSIGYLNGVVSANTGVQSNTYTNVIIHFVAGQSAFNGTGANNGPNAQVFFMAIWNRQLTSAEALQLYTDPYSLLVPAEPEMQIVQDDLQAQILL